jgi:hypothetical protein
MSKPLRLIILLGSAILDSEGVEEANEVNKEVAMEWFKRGYRRAGNSRCVSRLAEDIMRNKEWSKVPESVWWVMMHALGGNKYAYSELSVASENGHPYAQCARSFILAIGFSSPKLSVSPDLKEARACIPNMKAMDRFIEAGKKEELFNDDYQKIFRKLTAGLEAKSEEKIDIFMGLRR